MNVRKKFVSVINVNKKFLLVNVAYVHSYTLFNGRLTGYFGLVKNKIFTIHFWVYKAPLNSYQLHFLSDGTLTLS